MSGNILIVDSVATNRILVRAKLLVAQYRVHCAATPDEARLRIAEDRPDLVLVELDADAAAATALIRDILAEGLTSPIPVIAFGHGCSAADRIAALSAGADDILLRPLPDALLQARIRSLLRARDAETELRLRDDTSRALGFAEAPDTFAHPGRVAMIDLGVPPQGLQAEDLSRELGLQVERLTADSALSDRPGTADPDLFILPAVDTEGRHDVGKVFRLVADLRSRSESRRAAQLIVFPPGTPEIAAMALDLGANDVVTAQADTREIALRARALLRRKASLDRLRATVQSGLKAAVTDPLTGLYNRRYAIPYLATLAERARSEGREFALMMLDIDHFKRINDTWGHATGDLVLIGVAQCLRENLRAVDLIARVGGEEFLIAMPETTPEQAQVAADRLRRKIEASLFPSDRPGKPVAVTLSIGVAVVGSPGSAGEDVDHMVGRADAALYRAKSAGRNTVDICRSAA